MGRTWQTIAYFVSRIAELQRKMKNQAYNILSFSRQAQNWVGQPGFPSTKFPRLKSSQHKLKQFFGQTLIFILLKNKIYEYKVLN